MMQLIFRTARHDADRRRIHSLQLQAPGSAGRPARPGLLPPRLRARTYLLLPAPLLSAPPAALRHAAPSPSRPLKAAAQRWPPEELSSVMSWHGLPREAVRAPSPDELNDNDGWGSGQPELLGGSPAHGRGWA